MHLQQTHQQERRGNKVTGGPQYYFHDLPDNIKLYLRQKKGVQVALVTPYGATKTQFMAVSKDAKLDAGRLVSGQVGHDRIQQAGAPESIGESIRRWFGLRTGAFEQIRIEIDVIDDAFYLKPLAYKLASSRSEKLIESSERPMTFTQDYISPFWRKHLDHIYRSNSTLVSWSLHEICRIVRDHLPATQLPHIQESDLLRASGPLHHLGIILGGHAGKGYDCHSEIRFPPYPTYTVPIELKRFSKNFSYQEKKYGKEELSRAVILCARHDKSQVKRNIDVIELAALCSYADTLPA